MRRDVRTKRKLPLIDSIKPFGSVWRCIEGELRRQRETAAQQSQHWKDFDNTIGDLCNFIAPFNKPLDKLLLVSGENSRQRDKKLKEMLDLVKKLRRWEDIADEAIRQLNRLEFHPVPQPDEGDIGDHAGGNLRLKLILYSSVLWSISNRLEYYKEDFTSRQNIRTPRNGKGESKGSATPISWKRREALYYSLVGKVKKALAPT